MRTHDSILRANTPRWRVALLGESLQARASLAEGIRRTGGAVVLTRSSAAEGLDFINRARPDIAIVAPEPAWYGGALLLRLRDEACCPVVLLAQGPSRRLLDEAVEGGVMACLIEPVRAVQLASTLDLAIARFREMRGLRQALADRKVIERAKGLLMARQGLTEDEAFRRLRRSAMNTQRPLADTARALLSAEAFTASA
jgi:AmiR/NasT family two-component response regulator